MCLLAVAISSGIVLTLFSVLRVQTAESMARRQMAVNVSLCEAGVENAIAVLLDQPNFRGSIGPIIVPAYPDRTYSATLVDVNGDIALTIVSRAGSAQSSTTRLIKASDLASRRAALGL
jgi:hypothetical protein